MSDVTYRRGVEQDAPVLFAVLEAALAAEQTAGAIAHAFPDRAREIAWLRYLLRDPAGISWVAEFDGLPSGFGISVRRGEVRWLACLFVLPEHQGRGLGGRLLQELWPDEVESRATLVDASSRLAMTLYLRRGLVPQGNVLSMQGVIPSPQANAPALRADNDWAESESTVEALDRQVFGAPRSQDHLQWTDQGYAFRSLRGRSGEWLGYARWTPAGRLGPVAVADVDVWPAALEAVSGELRAAGIESAQVLIPGSNTHALGWFLEHSFTYRGMEIALATEPVGDWSRCLFHRAALP